MKEGDKVKVNDTTSPLNGKTGTVKSSGGATPGSTDKTWNVQLDDGTTHAVSEKHLAATR